MGGGWWAGVVVAGAGQYVELYITQSPRATRAHLWPLPDPLQLLLHLLRLFAVLPLLQVQPVRLAPQPRGVVALERQHRPPVYLQNPPRNVVQKVAAR